MQICDHVHDCADGSDEDFNNCFPGNDRRFSQSTNENNAYMEWQETQLQCVTSEKHFDFLINDLVADCYDESDEEEFVHYLNKSEVGVDVCDDPLSSPCSRGYSSVCYARHDICIYKEDERGLLSPCRNGAHLRRCMEHECPTMFKCPSAHCVRRNNVCDGIGHCPFGEDELNCTYGSAKPCPGFFKCKDSHMCIDITQICDGVTDCVIRGDDEINCNPMPCPAKCICLGMSYYCSSSNISELPSFDPGIKILLADNNRLLKIPNLNLSSLKKLDLQFNKISNLFPQTLSNCVNLLFLNLSYNALRHIKRYYFAGLENLHGLSLSGNPLSDLDSRSFDNMVFLSSLTLSSPFIRSLPTCLFQDLRLLEYLELQDMNLIELSDTFLCGNHNLKILRILNMSVSYTRYELFGEISGDLVVKTDLKHVCCSVSHRISCTQENGDFFSCSHIMPSRTTEVLVWIASISILLSNAVSIIFWLGTDSNPSWLLFVIPLNLTDALMGVYAIVLSVTDIYYHKQYTSWDRQVWQKSASCSFGVFFTQFSYHMSLYLHTAQGVQRLLLTKFAIGRIKINTKIWTILSLPTLLMSVILNCIDIFLVKSDDTESVLCLFVNVNSVYSQVIALCYEATLTVSLAVLNGIVLAYLMQSIVPGQSNTLYNTHHKHIHPRLIIVPAMYTITCLVLLFTRVGILSGVNMATHITDKVIITCLSINAIANPIINTFSRSIFIKKFQK